MVLFEYIIRMNFPQSRMRPSIVITNSALMLGHWLYKFGSTVALLFDYMTYYTILKKIFTTLLPEIIRFLKNIDKILRRFLIKLDYYLRRILRNIYTYTPLQDIVTLMIVFIGFLKAFKQFLIGYETYYLKLINTIHLEGVIRKVIATFCISLIILIVGLCYIYDISNLYHQFIYILCHKLIDCISIIFIISGTVMIVVSFLLFFMT